MTTGWLPDVVPNEPIESEWGNTIRDRTITPFPNAAARDAAILTPTDGMAVYLEDSDVLQVRVAGAWRAAGDMVKLGAVALASPGIVTFNTIPATFTHLELHGTVRGAGAALSDYCNLRFNSDAASNYDSLRTRNSAGAVTPEASAAALASFLGHVACNGAAGPLWSPISITIPHYTGSVWKAFFSRTAYLDMTTPRQDDGSGQWRSTAVISRIDLSIGGTWGGNFMTGTRVSLVGIV